MFTEAIAELLLLQAPPGVLCDRFVVRPVHTLSVPLIAGGVDSTFIL